MRVVKSRLVANGLLCVSQWPSSAHTAWHERQAPEADAPQKWRASKWKRLCSSQQSVTFCQGAANIRRQVHGRSRMSTCDTRCTPLASQLAVRLARSSWWEDFSPNIDLLTRGGFKCRYVTWHFGPFQEPESKHKHLLRYVKEIFIFAHRTSWDSVNTS